MKRFLFIFPINAHVKNKWVVSEKILKTRFSMVNNTLHDGSHLAFQIVTKITYLRTKLSNNNPRKVCVKIFKWFLMLVTKYQISAINSYWEKCDEKYLGRTDGRGKTVYPPPPSGSGGIKIIGPERNVNLICNSSLYTYIPKIKSISPSIVKKSGEN